MIFWGRCGSPRCRWPLRSMGGRRQYADFGIRQSLALTVAIAFVLAVRRYVLLYLASGEFTRDLSRAPNLASFINQGAPSRPFVLKPNRFEVSSAFALNASESQYPKLES